MRDIFHALSDNGNAIVSKMLIYVGLGGSSVGVTTKAVEMAGRMPEAAFDVAYWGGVSGIIGGVCLVIKTSSDVYFNYQKNKRENELHEMKGRKDGVNS